MIHIFMIHEHQFKAVLYDGSNYAELDELLGTDLFKEDGIIKYHTARSDMTICVNEYVIKDGSYICTMPKDTFENIYGRYKKND